MTQRIGFSRIFSFSSSLAAVPSSVAFFLPPAGTHKKARLSGLFSFVFFVFNVALDESTRLAHR
jgi:hypothetical protein